MNFDASGYGKVLGLLDPSLTQLLFQYVLLRHQSGAMSTPDDFITSAPKLYADPLTESLLSLA